MFNASTRAVDETANIAPENSLRRIETWSNEQLAQLKVKQDLSQLQTAAFVDFDTVATAKVESAIAEVNSVANELEKNDWRDIEQTKISTDLDLRPQFCATCSGLSCDGSCASDHRREATKNLQPVVLSEPIVIVATTSSDTIPPFADHPVNTVVSVPDDNELLEMQTDFIEKAVEAASKTIAEVPYVEVEELTELEMPIGTTESFDDLTHDEWIAMFGPEPTTQSIAELACPSCHSSECTDPNCGQTQTSEVVETPTDTETNDFQFPIPSSNNVAMDASANLLLEIIDNDSNNDFQAVTHLAEVTESNNFAPAESTYTETVEQKTLELPVLESIKANETVHVPDATPTPLMHRPQLYTGPNVRFEVIDNTVPWSEKLDETIQSVQSRLSIESEPETKNGLEINLRLLEVLKRQMIDVEDRKDALTNEEKQYWQHQLDAIALMLNSDGQGSDLDRHNTAINTLDHLRKAVERLESIADLKISNGEFCTEVSGFGQFKAFTSTTFNSDQRMLVYCEVENYSSVQREINAQSQVQTQLRGSYAIYDQDGKAVQQSAYPVVDDIARKRRRDFYMHFPIQLNNLPAGKYKLQLLVEDLNGSKSAGLEPGLEFEVQ